MLDNQIVLQISATENIIIYLPCSMNEIYRDDTVVVVFSNGEREYVLCKGDSFIVNSIISVITSLRKRLELVINNAAEIAPSLLEKGIGYLANERFQHKLESDGNTDQGGKWIGYEYSLWRAKEYQTWLYNKDNEIYLEITPFYKWHFSGMPKPDERDEFMTYAKFIKKYETCVLRTITKEIARQWLKTCERLIHCMEENYKFFQESCKPKDMEST